jgi:hypothetical protein
MNKPILLLSVLLLGLAGCTYNYGVAGQCCGPGHLPHTGYSVVNNSGVSLDIYQDGIRVAQISDRGTCCPSDPSFSSRRATSLPWATTPTAPTPARITGRFSVDSLKCGPLESSIDLERRHPYGCSNPAGCEEMG